MRRLLLCCFVYAFTFVDFRHTGDARERIWQAAIMTMAVGGALSLTDNILDQPERGILSRTLRALSATLALAAVVLAAGYELARPGVQEAVGHAYRRSTVYVGPSLTFISTAVLAAVGYGFFLLKTKKLIVYAWTEIVFTLTSCYVAISRAKHDASIGTVTVLGAAVYLTVRGLDNRKRALDEKRLA